MPALYKDTKWIKLPIACPLCALIYMGAIRRNDPSGDILYFEHVHFGGHFGGSKIMVTLWNMVIHQICAFWGSFWGVERPI